MITILAWLVIPIALSIVIVLLIRPTSSEYDGIARRQRALKALEECSGQRAPDDGDSSAGWLVDPDGYWPRRVRLLTEGGAAFPADTSPEAGEE